MDKPNFENSFSVDDIHKLREYNYEITKNMTKEERIVYINNKAKKAKEKINKIKAEREKMAI